MTRRKSLRQVTQKIQIMTLTMATKASLPHRWSSSSQSDRKTIDNNDPRSDCSEAHADPDELLADYQILLAELQQPRDRLKDELFQALNSSREVAKPRR